MLGSLSLLIFLNMTASLTRWALMRSYSSSICKQRWGQIGNNGRNEDNERQQGAKRDKERGPTRKIVAALS